MITTGLVRNTAVSSPHESREREDESARIVCEIAERLAELDTLKRFSAADLVARLHGVATCAPRMFGPLIACMHGNTERILDSYHVQAARRGLTKQAVHIEWQTGITVLRGCFPRVAGVLEEIRASAMNHEDPESAADMVAASKNPQDEY